MAHNGYDIRHIWYPEAGRGDQESNPGLQLDRPMLYLLVSETLGGGWFF